MEAQQRNLDGLLLFLEWAKKNGYAHAGTSDNRIRVAKEVFPAVKNVDTTDVTKLDIDDIFQRYTTLMSTKIPSSTLLGYQTHLKSAVREFKKYLADPLHYKATVSRKRKDTSSKTPAEKPTTVEKPTETAKPPAAGMTDNLTPPHSTEVARAPTIHIDFQIHISPDTDSTLVDKIFESLSKYFPNK